MKYYLPFFCWISVNQKFLKGLIILDLHFFSDNYWKYAGGQYFWQIVPKVLPLIHYKFYSSFNHPSSVVLNIELVLFWRCRVSSIWPKKNIGLFAKIRPCEILFSPTRRRKLSTFYFFEIHMKEHERILAMNYFWVSTAPFLQ